LEGKVLGIRGFLIPWGFFSTSLWGQKGGISPGFKILVFQKFPQRKRKGFGEGKKGVEEREV